MKALAMVFGLLVLPGMAMGQIGPCFFMDFDEDGIADYDNYITRVDLGFFEPATLYIGVCWPGHCDPDLGLGMGTAEYHVIYAGSVVPSVTTYSEPGAPTWALAIGDLLNGGWVQAGPCRDACSGEFIAVLNVTGTGSLQTFDFAPTAAPYDFPGLFQVYDCVPDPYPAGARNNAACNGDPNPVTLVPECNCPDDCVSAGSHSWGTVKSMFK